MRRLSIFLVFILLAVSVDAKKKRKKYEELKCNNPKYTYSIILPPTYEQKANKKFPALFISSPQGKPKTMGLNSWAAENEVIIILNRTTKNYQKESYSVGWKTLMETVESKYRIHPFLRFSTGFSGGAASSAQASSDYPNKWAGVILQAHSGNGNWPPKHCAVAFLAGDADSTHGVEYVRSAYEKLKKAGNPVHITVYPGRGHKTAPVEDVIKELDWMLNLKRYDHPSINSTYIKEITLEIEKKIQEKLKIQDAEEKMKEIDKFMVIPWIASMKGYDSLAKEFIKAKLACAAKETDELETWISLTEIFHSNLFKKADKETKASIISKLNKLARNKKVLKERAPMGKYFRAYKKQQKYKLAKKKSKKVRAKILKEYQSILDRYSDSRAAVKAKEAMKDF